MVLRRVDLVLEQDLPPSSLTRAKGSVRIGGTSRKGVLRRAEACLRHRLQDERACNSYPRPTMIRIPIFHAHHLLEVIDQNKQAEHTHSILSSDLLPRASHIHMAAPLVPCLLVLRLPVEETLTELGRLDRSVMASTFL